MQGEREKNELKSQTNYAKYVHDIIQKNFAMEIFGKALELTNHENVNVHEWKLENDEMRIYYRGNEPSSKIIKALEIEGSRAKLKIKFVKSLPFDLSFDKSFDSKES